MPRNSSDTPYLFCEWVVGTTIPAAMERKHRKRHRKRDVVTVEITTDDESEKDTVKISYPRTSRWASIAAAEEAAEAVVKKVRFEDRHPTRSSMRKNRQKSTSEDATSGSDGDISSDSEASGTNVRCFAWQYIGYIDSLQMARNQAKLRQKNSKPFLVTARD